MLILNLGCGTKVSSQPEVLNIDWSMYLRLKQSALLRPIARLLLDAERRRRFDALPDNIRCYNLARGIPFPADSVDAVYHSHLLEHLDRNVAEAFLLEIHRVLKPGGILRIVVPDFERLARAYLAHLAEADRLPEEAARHDDSIAALIEQSVRREGFGTSQQRPFRRFVENLVLGDARRRGETHQWMYDRVSLAALLVRLGYQSVELQSYASSAIPGWQGYGLDLDDKGQEYKPGSLYMEARK